MTMRQKLNLITLGVENLERALNFYEKGLGWKKSDKSVDDLALFPLGGITLALYPREDLAADVTLPYSHTSHPDFPVSHFHTIPNQKMKLTRCLRKWKLSALKLLNRHKKYFGAVIVGISKIWMDMYLK